MNYKIYQLKRGQNNHNLLFSSLKELRRMGADVSKQNYELVYEGERVLSVNGINATLEDLFFQFNVCRPEDFTGRSLSVSDVLCLDIDGEQKAYYVDSFGFDEIGGWRE